VLLQIAANPLMLAPVTRLGEDAMLTTVDSSHFAALAEELNFWQLMVRSREGSALALHPSTTCTLAHMPAWWASRKQLVEPCFHSHISTHSSMPVVCAVPRWKGRPMCSELHVCGGLTAGSLPDGW
jgi:hypothetical protein